MQRCQFLILVFISTLFFLYIITHILSLLISNLKERITQEFKVRIFWDERSSEFENNSVKAFDKFFCFVFGSLREKLISDCFLSFSLCSEELKGVRQMNNIDFIFKVLKDFFLRVDRVFSIIMCIDLNSMVNIVKSLI
jgi:hypothetical protein